jgi:D-glycero-D-manno-heptose 1,7-bisphosphate phosphatase
VLIRNFFIDIGTVDNLNLAKKKLPSFFRRPAAFLDRDGVINIDSNYVYKIKDFQFKKNVLKALKFLIESKYYIFIVTNQAGIGKKKYSLKNFFKLHKYLKHYLNQKNINFDDVQYSPYHRKALIKKYRKNSLYRKPNNGMVNMIMRNWFLKRNKSFFIGDKKSDKLCAEKSNLYFKYSKENLFTLIKKIVGRNL